MEPHLGELHNGEIELKYIYPGNYSAYGFEILLSRSLGPFILSVYLPSAMFVMMSWVSFFVPPVRNGRSKSSQIMIRFRMKNVVYFKMLKTPSLINIFRISFLPE